MTVFANLDIQETVNSPARVGLLVMKNSGIDFYGNKYL